jgi:hypothetical protein
MTGMLQGYPGIEFATGEEVGLFDTTGPVQVVDAGLMSAMQVAGCLGVDLKNMLMGGDFATNPWARGTSFTGITNTPVYTADRFFAVGAAGSSISVSRQAVAAGALSSLGNRFTQALRFGRAASNADLNEIYLGQVLESAHSAPYQGRRVAFSFWARAGANFSALGNLLNVRVVTGTGTDQSAANAVAGTWTGYSNRQLAVPSNGVRNIGGGAAGNPSGTEAAVILTNANNVQLTTSYVRYYLTALIPADANQIGVLLSYVPVGTAGANDFFEVLGLQLEPVAATLPFPSPFEFRKAAVEDLLCRRYCQSFPEPAAAVAVAPGLATGAAAQKIAIPLYPPMRAAPTMTIPTAGTFRINVAGTPTAVTLAAATSTRNCGNLTGGATNTAGQAVLLEGNGGAGLIVASAEL